VFYIKCLILSLKDHVKLADGAISKFQVAGMGQQCGVGVGAEHRTVNRWGQAIVSTLHFLGAIPISHATLFLIFINGLGHFSDLMHGQNNFTRRTGNPPI